MSVLYITQQGATLHKSGGRLIVRKGKTVLEELPAIHVEQVVIFGNGHLTTPAAAFLLNEGIDVAFLSSRGRYRGRLQPEFAKDTMLRKRQYETAADPQQALALAKSFVRGKLTNAVNFCLRQREQHTQVENAVQSIRQIVQRMDGAENIEALLGHEGAGSAAYFSALRAFMKHDFGFTTRQFRPPPDPVNAMLSLGYTMLYNHVYAFINVVGFDPYCGFFHQPRHGHATLASDLMEEFRAIIVDGYVLSLINRDYVHPEDFQQTAQGIRFTKEALDRFLAGYHGRMQQTFQHPTMNEQTTYLRSIELQVRHLARVISGEEPAYQPFILRT
jgi:CRISP-associated protein Cas1